ncbi:protein FAM45A-like, partial [Asbolus verrucosus]
RENNHNFLTWTYPTITEEQERHILQNCFTQDHIGCICLRINNIWFYIHQQTTFTKKFAIILLTKEFEPNKYRILCDILGKKYLTCQNPVELELLTVTNLVPCRNANDYLYPLILTPNKLKGLSFYVAGTTNGELIGEEDLYDLFLNMESQKITISPKAEALAENIMML